MRPSGRQDGANLSAACMRTWSYNHWCQWCTMHDQSLPTNLYSELCKDSMWLNISHSLQLSTISFRLSLVKETRSFESSNGRTNKNHPKRTSNGSNSFAFTIWIPPCGQNGLKLIVLLWPQYSTPSAEILESTFAANALSGVKHLLSNQLANYRTFFDGIGLLACLAMLGPCRRVRGSWWIRYDPSWCFGWSP